MSCDAHAEADGRLPVDGDVGLQAALLAIGGDVGEPGARLQLLDDLRHPGVELVDLGTPQRELVVRLPWRRADADVLRRRS